MTARDRMVVMVVGTLVLLAAVWFLAIGPRHKQYSSVASKADDASAQLQAARQDLTRAQAAKKSYPGDYSQVAQLGKAVPVDDEVPSLVYQLSSAAGDNHIDFRSIKLSSSTAGATAAAPAAAAPASTTTTTSTTSTTSTTGTTSTTATPAAAAPATNVTAATLPPGASIGPAGFPVMPFDFVFDGSFFDMSAFLKQVGDFTTLNGNSLAVRGRLLTINGISLKAGREGFPKVQASINATAFLLPADQGLTAGGTATAPASTSAATASSGSGSSATPAATASR